MTDSEWAAHAVHVMLGRIAYALADQYLEAAIRLREWVR